MDLTNDQKEFYSQARERCKTEVAQMNRTIRTEWDRLNSEIVRVQNLMGELENKKQIVGQMHGNASMMLGVADDLDVSPAIQEAGAEA